MKKSKLQFKVQKLRGTYPRFFYRAYQYQLKRGNLEVTFYFEVPPDIRFHPKVVIKNVSLPKSDLDNLENLVFHLGLMEIPSYWKATCSPEIIIEAGSLNTEQIAWWKDLILKGMGEYFFKNNINFAAPNFLAITSLSRPSSGKLGRDKFPLKRVMVPVGGGKDAAVTLELLKKAGMKVTPFLLNPRPEQMNILSRTKARLPARQAEKPIIVERTIDPKLLELNRKGYLNGHTPFSAYLAFLSVLAGALFNIKYIALSNERSSNEGNVKYLGKTINHQYSKSFEFEKKFRQYCKKYLVKDIEYFSFLRPLYELQIAKLFAKYPKYFPVFLSCNEARKTYSGTKPTGLPAVGRLRRPKAGKWCGKCAKCMFVFIASYPFAGKKQTVNIFKKDLLKDKRLMPLLEELTGKKKFKPFECVGTIEESKAALTLSLGKIKDHKILHAWNNQNFLPPAFKKLLKKAVDR